MANIKFIYPVQEVSGSMTEDNKVSFRTRFGKTHSYHLRHPSTAPDSEARIAHRQAFGEARRQAKLELQDPIRHEQWLKLFKKQKQYVRLDGFVVAQLLKGISV